MTSHGRRMWESDTPGRHDQLAKWLALKDRALDVAAEGVTIADARRPAGRSSTSTRASSA